MRATPQPHFAPGANYQRFAAAIIGLAVLVAIGASEQDVAAAAGPPVASAAAPRPAAAKAPTAQAAFALADEAEVEPSQAAADDTPTVQGDPAADAAPSGAPPPPVPTAPELSQLAASSQARSGGIEQGDAPTGNAVQGQR